MSSLLAPTTNAEKQDDPSVLPETSLGGGENSEQGNVIIVPLTDVVAVQVDPLETVTVRAPSDLHAGYCLNVVDESGRSVCVQVPVGGVRAGEQFNGILVHPSPTTHEPSLSLRSPPSDHVPIGDWRDGICDCCEYGPCHPVFCLGFWATPLVLGQTMTRLNLNACAEDHPATKPKCTAFRVMLLLFTVSVCTSTVVGQLMGAVFFGDESENNNEDGSDDDADGGTDDTDGWQVGLRLARIGISFFFHVFVFIVAIRTRAYIRKKYKIRPHCCGECEDLCCAMFCYCCMVCQLSRHMVDFEHHSATCCTETGLVAEAPTPV